MTDFVPLKERLKLVDAWIKRDKEVYPENENDHNPNYHQALGEQATLKNVLEDLEAVQDDDWKECQRIYKLSSKGKITKKDKEAVLRLRSKMNVLDDLIGKEESV